MSIVKALEIWALWAALGYLGGALVFYLFEGSRIDRARYRLAAWVGRKIQRKPR